MLHGWSSLHFALEQENAAHRAAFLIASTVNTVNLKSCTIAVANLHRDTDVPGTDILEAEIASFGELKLWSGPASSVTRLKQ